MPLSTTRTRLLAVLIVALLLCTAAPALGSPVDVEVEGLRAQLRPAITPLGKPVHLKVDLGEDDDEAVPAPEEPTEAPEEPTEAPDEPTEAPDEPAEAPEEPTEAPEEGGDTAALTAPAERGRGPSVAIPGDHSVVVDFGDGTAPVSYSGVRKLRITHRYAAEGTYTVRITASTADAPAVEQELTATVGAGSARLASRDRFGTGVRISQEAFPEAGSASAVLLARGDTFADALAASSLTMAEDASVLLTGATALPPQVAEEIQRVLAEDGTVYIFGGEQAVSPEVAAAIEALGFTTERIAGTDRIDTSVQIARFLLARGVAVDEVVVAGAGSFPDALAIAPHAARAAAPVLLTGRTQLDPRVTELLAELGAVDVLVVGGPGVVSAQVVAELEAAGHAVQRLAGRTRFETAVAVAEATAPAASGVVVATGGDFADALSGASYAGRSGAVLLLVGSEVPGAARELLGGRGAEVRTLHVLGGERAVPEQVRRDLESLLARP